jgi:2,5-dihydroxypyridine 5,6-dioxygenase
MLRLCNANADENIAIVSQGDERMDYVDAFLGAAERIGSTTFHLRLPNATLAIGGDVGVWKVGATPLTGHRPAIEALKHADLVVDTMFIQIGRAHV